MAGLLKKIKGVARSMSSEDCEVDFNPDYSTAVEYKGPQVNHSIPQAIPVDFCDIPVAKAATSAVLLNDLSLPIVQPIVRSKNHKSVSKDVGVNLGSSVCESVKPRTSFEERGVYADDDHVCSGEIDDGLGSMEGNDHLRKFEDREMDGDCPETSDECFPKFPDGIESSGSLVFSDSRDHSNELSESSDMIDTLMDRDEIEGIHSEEPSSRHQGFLAVNCTEEEEIVSEEEALQRRKKGPTVTFCDLESSEMDEEPVGVEVKDVQERRVPERTVKKGLCYRCLSGSRFTEKESCIVCDAKYCSICVLRAMGSMPEGRKCLNCIGYPIDESKRKVLGKCSRMLRRLLHPLEVKQIMNSEVSCDANQLAPEGVHVNGEPLSPDEMRLLLSCKVPPRSLRPGKYWYDKVAGLWGKEGHKPCQFISPDLSVGETIQQDASNGNTNVLINNREITKSELLMLQLAGVQCAGSPRFWVYPDGSYQEEGMQQIAKAKIWSRRGTKLLCTLLSLPTLSFSNSCGTQSNHEADGEVPTYHAQKSFYRFLLVGNDSSGTSTIFKQARNLYNVPFSEKERQSIKFLIQSNLYGYLGILLEARERFEEESWSEMTRSQCTDQPGPSEVYGKNIYSIGPRLKAFSDWLINIMVSGNLDIIFPAATREYAPCVEEFWKDAAIQATYSRRNELELPRVASYFLDRAVEIAKADYEPSDTDMLYVEGITSSNGLASMEFSFSRASHDSYLDPVAQHDSVTRYELVWVHVKILGENCKWVEMFEDVGIILFCVALTDYDEYEIDSNGVLTNKMMASKRFFESIITHPSFKETNFLLILNKFDLLEEKIEQVPLTQCQWFEDFNPVLSRGRSGRSSANSIPPLAQRAFHYIAVRFKNLFKSLTRRKLYVFPVTDLEEDSVDGALRYGREIIRWEEEKLSYSFNEISSESIEVSTFS